MSVSIRVREEETIEDALRRFRELVRRYGHPGVRRRPAWHKNQLTYYLKPSALRRRKRIRDEWQKFSGECGRQKLVAPIVRGKKRRKAHFPV